MSAHHDGSPPHLRSPPSCGIAFLMLIFFDVNLSFFFYFLLNFVKFLLLAFVGGPSF